MMMDDSDIILSKEVEVYYVPITGPFNLYPFHGGVSSAFDIDDIAVLDGYLERFKEAWEELAANG